MKAQKKSNKKHESPEEIQQKAWKPRRNPLKSMKAQNKSNKKYEKCRTAIGTFLCTRLAFSPDKSANSGRKTRKICTGNFIRKPSILRRARLCPALPGSARSWGAIRPRSEAFPYAPVHRRTSVCSTQTPSNYYYYLLLIPGNAAMGRLIGSLYI